MFQLNKGLKRPTAPEPHQVREIIQNYLAGVPEAVLLFERFLTNIEMNATRNSMRDISTSILFTDIVGSTAIFEDFGNQYGRAIVAVHDEIVHTEAEICGGKLIKHTGDGMHLKFESSGRSIKSALRILKKIREHNNNFPLLELNIKIGVNVGLVIDEGIDVYGSSVNLAARLCDLAHPNTILTTGIVRSRCEGKGYNFHSLGKYSIKGFRLSIPIFKVTDGYV